MIEQHPTGPACRLTEFHSGPLHIGTRAHQRVGTVCRSDRPVREVIDVLVSVKRDLATTRRFFIRPGTWPRPSEVTTDRDLPSESHDGEPTHHHERASRWFDGQIRRLAPHTKQPPTGRVRQRVTPMRDRS
jgi:hypothetical protein